MAWFNWGETDTLEDKPRAGWVTPVLDHWAEILRRCFQRSHCDGHFRSLAGSCWLKSAWMSSHQEVVGNSKKDWLQETWLYLKYLIDLSGTWLCALSTNESSVFFLTLVFVLQDWMNKVLSLTGCYHEVASLFFSTSLLSPFSSFTGCKVVFLTEVDLGVMIRFWLIAGLRYPEMSYLLLIWLFFVNILLFLLGFLTHRIWTRLSFAQKSKHFAGGWQQGKHH